MSAHKQQGSRGSSWRRGGGGGGCSRDFGDLPRLHHHEGEIFVVVDGSADAGVVVNELIDCDRPVLVVAAAHRHQPCLDGHGGEQRPRQQAGRGPGRRPLGAGPQGGGGSGGSGGTLLPCGPSNESRKSLKTASSVFLPALTSGCWVASYSAMMSPSVMLPEPSLSSTA